MTAHNPSISVVLVNIKHCVDKTRFDVRAGYQQRLLFPAEFILAPHFPHGILHVCVSQGVDERVEHGGNHDVKQDKYFVISDRISRGDIDEDERSKKNIKTTVMCEPQVERALQRPSDEQIRVDRIMM